MIILPFLLVLVLGVGWIIWFTIEKQGGQKVCHTRTLTAQRILIKASDDVIKLNGWATALKRSKQLGKKMMDSKVPYVAQIGAVIYGLAISGQYILKGLQLSIIWMARFRAGREMWNLDRDIKKQQKNMAERWGKELDFDPHSYYSTGRVFATPGPAIEKENDWVAPKYKRTDTYAEDQQLEYYWFTSQENIVPDWMIKIFKFANPPRGQTQGTIDPRRVTRRDRNGWKGTWFHRVKWSGGCASYPQEKGEQWLANIGMARSS